MLERVICGGQTGADQAGWRAAQRAGIPTGGAMPKGFKTEDGPRPEFAALYGAYELESAEYPARTAANVQASDATLWFGRTGTKATNGPDLNAVPPISISVARFFIEEQSTGLSSMLERVISGGQTGADQAGWHAAKRAGIPTGGAMPKGFKTEDGNRPEFATEFGAHELDSEEYRERTWRNVIDSDGTLWFGNPESACGTSTISACRVLGKPHMVIPLKGVRFRPSHVAEWILDLNIKVLNVAGNRESTAPGIGARVEAFLARVFWIRQRQGDTAT